MVNEMITVNVLKFRTLFSLCSQIKWVSGLEITKTLNRIANREDPVRLILLIWVCPVFLDIFGRQLACEILQHLLLTWAGIRRH